MITKAKCKVTTSQVKTHVILYIFVISHGKLLNAKLLRKNRQTKGFRPESAGYYLEAGFETSGQGST